MAQARCAAPPPPAKRCCKPTLALADYPTLEVWDTTDRDALASQLESERVRLTDVFHLAREEKRPVIWKNARFDMKKVDRITGWLHQIRKDPRITW